MLAVKMFEADTDYEEICKWWIARKWPPVELDALSDFGMVAHDGSIGVAAGWLYLTTSKMSVLEWIVTNPVAPLKDRRTGIELILHRLIQESQKFGAKYIFSSLSSRSLIKLYKSYGFKESESGMTNLIHAERNDSCQLEHQPS